MTPSFENKVLKNAIESRSLRTEVKYLITPILSRHKTFKKNTNNNTYLSKKEKLKLMKPIKLFNSNKINYIPKRNHKAKNAFSYSPQTYSFHVKNNYSFQKIVKVKDNPLNANFDDYNNRGDDMNNLNESSIKNFILNKSMNKLLLMKYNNKYLEKIKLMNTLDNKKIINRKKIFQRNKNYSMKNKYFKSETLSQFPKLSSYKNFHTVKNL